MEQSKSVIINGDRNAFLSKGAIDRFKSDIRNKQAKPASQYLKEGWTFSVAEKDDHFFVDILLNMFKKELSSDEKQKKLSEKLKQLSRQRMSKTNDNLYKKNNVPEDIYNAYVNACKKMPLVPFMNPVDVLRHPEKYREDIKNIVESSTHLNNEYSTYYKSLHSYFVVNDAINHAKL
jgi:hypothetical protein